MRDGDGRNRVTRSGPSEWSSSLSWMAVSLVLVALTGVPATVLTLWAAEAVGPTYRQRAVVTRHDRADPDGNGVAGTYRVEARVANGRTLDITPWDRIVAGGEPGEPVVVHRSSLTDRVTGVRTVGEYVEYRHFRRYVNLFVVCLTILVSMYGAYLLRGCLAAIGPPIVPRGVAVTTLMIGCVGVVLLTVTLVSRGPGIPATDPRPGALSEDTVWWPAPAAVGRIGEVVETDDDVSVQVTGPPATTPPAGAPGRLGEFDVVTVPVRTVFRGDARRSDGAVRVRLIGAGRGRARLVTVPPCAAVLEPFRDTARATSPAAAGPLCFVVPPGFRPHYLALTANATGPDAVIDLADRRSR